MADRPNYFMKILFFKPFIGGNVTIVKLLIAVLVYVCLQNSISAADETQIFLLSDLGGSGVKHLQKVEDNTIDIKDNTKCSIKALIEPIRVSKNEVYKNRVLSINDRNFICQDKECFKSWRYDFYDSPISVSEYRNLKLSWNRSVYEKDPEINIELCLKKPKTKKDITLNGHYGKEIAIYKPLKIIDFKNEKYLRKNILYRIKREVGLDSGEEWRHSKSNDDLILQKIINVPMKDLHIVKIISDQKIKPRIVQFSIDADGNGFRDGYILFEEIISSIENKEGKSVLTLDLRPAIYKRKLNTGKAKLLEIIVFMPLTYDTYMQKKPLDKIQLLSTDKDIGVRYLNYKYEKNNNVYSLDFNFAEQVDSREYEDGLIYEMIIRTKLDGLKYFEWNDIQFYDTRKVMEPAIYDAPINALKDWNAGEGISLNSDIISFYPLFSKIIQDPVRRNFESHVGNNSDHIVRLEFSEKNNHLKNINKIKYKNKKGNAYGNTYYSISGTTNNSLVKGHIISTNNRNGFPVLLTNGLKRLELLKQNNDYIDDFEFDDSIYIENWPLQISFFNIVEHKASEIKNYCELEWWVKDTKLNFMINEEKTFFDKNMSKVAMITEKGKNKWIFELPEADIILPTKFIVPGNLPQPCKMTLEINKDNIDIPYGPYSLYLKDFQGNIKDIKVYFEYFGSEPIIWMNMPEVQVIGLKRTAVDDYAKLKATIDDKDIYVNQEALPHKIGDWISIGNIELRKGEHQIKAVNSNFFKIRSLILDGDKLAQLTANQFENKRRVSIWTRLLAIAGKGIIFIGVCAMIYLLFPKISSITNALFNPLLTIYTKCAEKILALIWFLLSVGLYSFGFILSGHEGINYPIALGDIAIVGFLFHSGKILKGEMQKRFPNYKLSILNYSGSLFLIWAIVFLFITAILTAIKFEIFADKTAIIAFYLFALGIFSKALKIYKSAENNEEMH